MFNLKLEFWLTGALTSLLETLETFTYENSLRCGYSTATPTIFQMASHPSE